MLGLVTIAREGKIRHVGLSNLVKEGKLVFYTQSTSVRKVGSDTLGLLTIAREGKIRHVGLSNYSKRK